MARKQNQVFNLFCDNHRLTVNLGLPHHLPWSQISNIKDVLYDSLDGFTGPKLELCIKFQSVHLRKSRFAICHGEVGLLGDSAPLFTHRVCDQPCSQSIKVMTQYLVLTARKHFFEHEEIGVDPVKCLSPIRNSCSANIIIAAMDKWIREKEEKQ